MQCSSQFAENVSPQSNRLVHGVPPSVNEPVVLNAIEKKERRSSIVYGTQREKVAGLYRVKRPYSAKPNITTAARSRVPVPGLGLLLGMGPARLMRIDEADGGWRGRWEQARPIGAGDVNRGASHRPHPRVHLHRRLRKPPGQTPSQHVRSAFSQLTSATYAQANITITLIAKLRIH
jgi:hypothetical protein